jgi:hypothetical protein
MPVIEIDFDVFKALTALRESEAETVGDVVRNKLLKLPAKAPAPAAVNGEGAWEVKGVLFPAGTKFRGKYKGEWHPAHVEAGALVLNGQRFTSPSPAAGAITGNQTDGWKFWSVQLPGTSTWRKMKEFRK